MFSTKVLNLVIAYMNQTMFSMTFFNWIPPDSSQMVSPWIGLYFGATVVVTGLLHWLSNRWIQENVVTEEGFEKDLYSTSSSMV